MNRGGADRQKRTHTIAGKGTGVHTESPGIGRGSLRYDHPGISHRAGHEVSMY
jgi:hypothetical protein